MTAETCSAGGSVRAISQIVAGCRMHRLGRDEITTVNPESDRNPGQSKDPRRADDDLFPPAGRSAPSQDARHKANGLPIWPDQHDQGRHVLTPGTSGKRRFLRALVFGGLAAAVGAVGYCAVIALTEAEFGLVALVLGLLVGLAVRWGSRRRGGWAYQGLAMFLTYLAIGTAYIPFGLAELPEEPGPDAQNGSVQPATSAPATGDRSESRPSGAEDDTPVWSEMTAGEKIGTIVVTVVVCFVMAMIMPIAANNLIGWIIVGIALYEAWRINKRPALDIAEPHASSDQAAQTDHTSV